MVFLLTGVRSAHIAIPLTLIDHQKYAQGEERPDTFLGLILIAGYLFSDGFTSTLQERLFKVSLRMRSLPDPPRATTCRPTSRCSTSAWPLPC